MNDFFDKLEKRQSRNDAKLFRDQMIKRSKGRCEVCNLFCPPIITIHHKIAVKDGGDGFPENLICLCPNCHAVIGEIQRMQRKYILGNEYLDEWVYQTFGIEIGDKLMAIAYNDYDSGFHPHKKKE